MSMANDDDKRRELSEAERRAEARKRIYGESFAYSLNERTFGEPLDDEDSEEGEAR